MKARIEYTGIELETSDFDEKPKIYLFYNILYLIHLLIVSSSVRESTNFSWNLIPFCRYSGGNLLLNYIF